MTTAISDAVLMLLPDIDDNVELIEVVRVEDPGGHWNDSSLVGDVVAIWEKEQVREVLALVADLPESERYRCFFPVWGIRAHSTTGLLFEIAFCYKCHGAALSGPTVAAGRRGIQTFDPDSPPAQELLERFRACAPQQNAGRAFLARVLPVLTSLPRRRTTPTDYSDTRNPDVADM